MEREDVGTGAKSQSEKRVIVIEGPLAITLGPSDSGPSGARVW